MDDDVAARAKARRAARASWVGRVASLEDLAVQQLVVEEPGALIAMVYGITLQAWPMQGCELPAYSPCTDSRQS